MCGTFLSTEGKKGKKLEMREKENQKKDTEKEERRIGESGGPGEGDIYKKERQERERRRTENEEMGTRERCGGDTWE